MKDKEKINIKKAETNLKNLNKRLKIVKEQEEISEKYLRLRQLIDLDT